MTDFILPNHEQKFCQQCCGNLKLKSKGKFCSFVCKRKAFRLGDLPPLIPGAKWLAIGHGAFTLLDDQDYEDLNQYPWRIINTKYTQYAARAISKNKRVLLHRVIMKAPSTHVIDHINGDGLDNRRQNLRLATNSQNSANCTQPVKNKSGYRGVYFDKRSNLWHAKIKFNYKSIFIGSYITPKEASIAYDLKASNLFGEFARLNGVIK